MKKWTALAAVLLLILGGIYIGSPYYAARDLRNAALEADTDKLEARVDFPAVRESLKSQISTAMMKQMQDDPEMRDNPFAGLGAILMPTIIDRMVENFVTPDGIAAMMRGQKPNEQAAPGSNPDVESRTEYVSLDRFRVHLRNRKSNEDGPAFLFERRGFATWKLIKVEMPADLLARKR